MSHPHGWSLSVLNGYMIDFTEPLYFIMSNCLDLHSCLVSPVFCTMACRESCHIAACSASVHVRLGTLLVIVNRVQIEGCGFVSGWAWLCAALFFSEMLFLLEAVQVVQHATTYWGLVSGPSHWDK